MVTVLMPTYNCAEYLPFSIKSILNQSYKDFEFLIIDDGSTDNTEEVVSHFKDSRICYIKKGHTGISDSLNYGLKKAVYNLIARMDADDIAHPMRLEKQLAFLKSNPKVDVLSSWYAIFQKEKIKYLVKTPTGHEEISKGLLLHSYLAHPGCIYDRNIILLNGGYSTEIYEDYELWLRLMNIVTFANIPEVLMFNRYRKNSLSNDNTLGKNKRHYDIQSSYYIAPSKFFKLTNTREEYAYCGWREYFWGDKKTARKLWRYKFVLLTNFKIFLAYFVSFLPNRLFIMWKEARVRYRIIYWFSYFSILSKTTRNSFNAFFTDSRYWVELAEINTDFFNPLPISRKKIIYADFNVLNYCYENKLVIPNNIFAYPDSTAIYIYISYFLRKRNRKHVSTDIQEHILNYADKHTQKVFFFGDSDEVLNYLQQNVQAKYPHIQIVGVHSGYEFKTDQVLNQINKLGPDILFVGLGVGRQEKWIIENNERINAKLTISVGGWFQYLAGNKKRAPKVLRDLHLEWAHKLIIEYDRVWKRYLLGVPKFFYRVITRKIVLELKEFKSIENTDL